jgi:hypothetical protein
LIALVENQRLARFAEIATENDRLATAARAAAATREPPDGRTR